MGKRKADSSAVAADKVESSATFLLAPAHEAKSMKGRVKQKASKIQAPRRSQRMKPVKTLMGLPLATGLDHKPEELVEGSISQRVDDGSLGKPGAATASLERPKNEDLVEVFGNKGQVREQTAGQRASPEAEEVAAQRAAPEGVNSLTGNAADQSKEDRLPQPGADFPATPSKESSRGKPLAAEIIASPPSLLEEDDDPEFWAKVLALEDEREQKERQAKLNIQEQQEQQQQERKRAHIRIRPSDLERTVWINRGPVLTLWAAVVAQRQGYTWQEALTFGRAIASKCAQAKGLRLGLKTGVGERGVRDAEFEEFEVFGMLIPGSRTKQGVRAVQDGHPTAPSTVESYLQKVFSLNLEFCKAALEVLAHAFSPEALGGACYRLYEDFRPQVPAGTGGWGAKGIFDLRLVLKLADDYARPG